MQFCVITTVGRDRSPRMVGGLSGSCGWVGGATAAATSPAPPSLPPPPPPPPPPSPRAKAWVDATRVKAMMPTRTILLSNLLNMFSSLDHRHGGVSHWSGGCPKGSSELDRG